MNYVDLIIKYLSGELSSEETVSFEKELERNPELREALEEQTVAFELIRRQLQERDMKLFRTKLEASMSRDLAPLNSHRLRLRPWWYIPPAVACLAALIVVLLTSRPESEKTFSRYHHPEKDPVILALYQDTRGEPEPGISEYHHGHYARAMELLSTRISREPENKPVLLYYLLSSMELDRQQEVLEILPPADISRMELLDQSLCWYGALALVKTGRKEAALPRLQELAGQDGPYRNEALSLEKVLLK